MASAGIKPKLLQNLPAMSDEQFARWARLLEERTGVVVPLARKAFVATSVRGRMLETGHTGFDAYYRDLQRGPDGAVEWITLVDRLTVHETSFFRHPPSLALIGEDWLRQPQVSGSTSPLHAWSVGCATGEEAYTLAMVLDFHLNSNVKARRYFGVTATDVSVPALAVARCALYPQQKLEQIPAQFRDRYCDRVDTDSFRIRESLRKRVGFASFNLLDVARAPLKRLDLIFCQNVLIYFARARRRELLATFAKLLKPGGLLVLGAGEVTGFAHPGLQRMQSRNVLAYVRNS